jgi:hypothetical protein
MVVPSLFQRSRITLAQRCRPVHPGVVVEVAAQRHEQRIVGQPAGSAVPELFELGLFGRTGGGLEPQPGAKQRGFRGGQVTVEPTMLHQCLQVDQPRIAGMGRQAEIG